MEEKKKINTRGTSWKNYLGKISSLLCARRPEEREGWSSPTASQQLYLTSRGKGTH